MLRPLAEHFVVGHQRAVDKRDIEIDQPIDDIKAVEFGADIQGRSHQDRLHDVAEHRLIALRLAAAYGMDGYVIGAQAELSDDLPRQARAQVARPCHADGLSFKILGPAYVFTRDHDVRKLDERGGDKLDIHPSCYAGKTAVGCAIVELELVRRQRGERRRLAADIDMFNFEAILFEDSVIEGRIEMNEAAGHRGCGDAQ